MTNRLTKNLNRALIALFFLALFLPLVDNVVHFDRYPRPDERRPVATFPALPKTWKDVLAFPAAFDAYYNDHFGGRNSLVRAYMTAKVRLFHASPITWSMLGKDDWCFLSHDQALKSFWDVDRDAPLDGRLNFYEKQRAIAEKYGARFIVAFGPDKATIYPEYLPNWMRPSPPPRSLTRLADYMARHSKIPFLDLTDTMLEAKKGDLVYNPVESHWNGIGAFAAYNALLVPMRSRFPQLPGIDPANLHRVSLPTGGKEASAEIDIDYFDRFPYLTFENAAPNAVRVSADPLLADLPNLKGKILTCYENKDKTLPKLIVFHDSFGYELRKYLPESFSRSVFLLDNTVHEDLIAREKPDIVLMLRVERSLYDYTGRPGDSPAKGPN